MRGDPRRVGLIVPSSNTVAEIELAHGLFPEVTLHTTRCIMPEVDDVDQKLALFRQTEDGGRLLEAAQELATIKPALIVWACTVGSFLKGGRHDLQLSASLQEAIGIPALTTTTALIWALEAMGLARSRIGLVTPYHRKIADMEQSYFETALPGLRIVARTDLGIVRGSSKGDLSPQTVIDAAARLLDNTGAEAGLDGLLISCTNWRTFEVIELLEEQTGLPVITSNQATLWAIRRLLKLSGPENPGGRLFGLDLSA